MKVFYYLRRNPRGRQQDTIRSAPAIIEAISPKFDYVEGKTVVSRGNIITHLLPYFPFALNLKALPKHINVDAVYLFCGLLKHNLPYVSEIDNPSCLTYYSPLSISNPLIVRIIKYFTSKSNFLSFLPLSNAARKGMLKLLDYDFEDKINVLYPPFLYDVEKKETELPSFIFISYHFLAKGGREIIKAVKQLKGKFKFTMVTTLPTKLNLPKQITIRNRVSRYELIHEILPLHDVVVHPTYMDSFGMAPYEGINVGLAGISTDMYALPEFVIHEKNGFNFPSPIEYFNKDYLPNLRFWSKTKIEHYVKTHQFPNVVKSLVEYMQYYIDNPKELKKHQKMSKHLAKTKFSLKERNKRLLKILERGK